MDETRLELEIQLAAQLAALWAGDYGAAVTSAEESEEQLLSLFATDD